jgi:hypothetical protein
MDPYVESLLTVELKSIISLSNSKQLNLIIRGKMSKKEIRVLKNALIGCEGNLSMMKKATDAARRFVT